MDLTYFKRYTKKVLKDEKYPSEADSDVTSLRSSASEKSRPGAKGVSACLFPGARPNFFRSSRELTYFQKHSMLAEKPFAFLSNRTNHWFANEPNDPN